MNQKSFKMFGNENIIKIKNNLIEYSAKNFELKMDVAIIDYKCQIYSVLSDM